MQGRAGWCRVGSSSGRHALSNFHHKCTATGAFVMEIGPPRPASDGSAPTTVGLHLAIRLSLTRRPWCANRVIVLAVQDGATSPTAFVQCPQPARASSGPRPIQRSRLYISNSAPSASVAGGTGTRNTGIAGSYPNGKLLSPGPLPT